MLSLFPRISLECLGNLRISLPVCLTGHCKIHSHFGAFSVEVVVEALHDLRILDNAVSESVLASEGKTCALNDFNELLSFCMALWALCRRIFALIDETANQTSEFLFHFFKNYPLIKIVLNCHTNICIYFQI